MQITYYWEAGLDVEVVCELDYQPPERGRRVDGLQIEPDLEAEAMLTQALVRDVDILPILSNAQIERIEELAVIRQLEV